LYEGVSIETVLHTFPVQMPTAAHTRNCRRSCMIDEHLPCVVAVCLKYSFWRVDCGVDCFCGARGCPSRQPRRRRCCRRCCGPALSDFVSLIFTQLEFKRPVLELLTGRPKIQERRVDYVFVSSARAKNQELLHSSVYEPTQLASRRRVRLR
jgi:hypothetical protein